MKAKVFLIPLLIATNNAVSQQCESLISLSKVANTTTADKSAVESHANNFCNEYSKSGGKSSSNSFGASYKFLSLSSASSDTSVEAIASRYCSASSGFSQSSDAYRQYVESIAPGAFEAYQQCIQLASRDVQFSLSSAGTLPDEFSMTVSFKGSDKANKSATLLVNPASGISCHWDGRKGSDAVIGTGQTSVLRCERTDTGKRGYVVIARTDGTKDSMTIPWQAYNKDGVPTNALAALEDQLRAAQRQASGLEVRISQLTAQIAAIESSYVKSNDTSYLRNRDKVRIFGRPNTNECIFSLGGNGGTVVTGDCGHIPATTWELSK